jgi:hypothetical protein
MENRLLSAAGELEQDGCSVILVLQKTKKRYS